MRCKDVERLMIEGSDRTLTRQERNAIEKHLTRCSSCARFREDLLKIRNGLKIFSSPAPSDKLVKKTRSLCHAEMEASGAYGSKAIQRTQPGAVPKIIWAALFVLVILSGILIISFLPGFEAEKSLSLRTALIFTLIVQNAAMLFFSPVLIQKFWPPKNGLGLNEYENLAP